MWYDDFLDMFKGILGSIKDVLREKCYIYSDLDPVLSQKIRSQTWMTFKSK